MLRRFSFASLVSGCALRGEPSSTVLLEAKASNSWSTLKWLGQGASGESPGSIKSEVAKLAFLRQLGAHEWDLSDFNPNRRKLVENTELEEPAIDFVTAFAWAKEVSKASIVKILDVSRSVLYHFIETRKIAPD